MLRSAHGPETRALKSSDPGPVLRLHHVFQAVLLELRRLRCRVLEFGISGLDLLGMRGLIDFGVHGTVVWGWWLWFRVQA